MTSIFDGMGPTLRALLGGSVSVTPVGGSAQTVTAIFRASESVMTQLDGFERQSFLPVVHVNRADLAKFPVRAMVEPGDGKKYRVVAPLNSGSPAFDANVPVQLELVGNASD